MAGTRNYQSIGEVLVAVKTEFPDITISKIRFLESEGLITPERTPSGYRKFYVDDVDRLKSILRMQRDEYLPLKVIKERLVQSDAGAEGDDADLGAAADGEGASVSEELAEAPTGLQMSLEEMSAATGVDRESSFFEALVAPTLRQRNPDARRAATQTLTDLSVTSRKFKQALLRNALREHLTSA